MRFLRIIALYYTVHISLLDFSLSGHFSAMKSVIGLIFLLPFVLGSFPVDENYPLSPFPKHEYLVYSYHAEIEAGTSQPSNYASKYVISADLIVHPLSNCPSQQCVNIHLNNISIHWLNGPRSRETIPADIDHSDLNLPFMIILKDNKIENLKFFNDDSEHSINMKKAISSMFQMEINDNIYDGRTMNSSLIESTIRGDCPIVYRLRGVPETSRDFILTKSLLPHQCTNFELSRFDHYDYAGCHLDPIDIEPLPSETEYQVTRYSDHILIKSILSQGGVLYTKGSSYVHTNVSLDLKDTKSARPLQPDSRYESPLTTDMSYQRLNGANKAKFTIPWTEEVDPSITKTIEMLIEINEYIRSDLLKHDDLTEDRGPMINDVVRLMSSLDSLSFEKVLQNLEKLNSSQEMFFELLSHVGTHASSIFIRDLVVQGRVGDEVAFGLLMKFPVYVRDPTYELLRDMEPLMHMIQTAQEDRYIYEEAMLSYATLISRVFRASSPNGFNGEVCDSYVDSFGKLLSDPDYNKKVIAILALGNIGMGSANRMLIDIVYDKPHVAYKSPGNLTDHQILSLRILAATSLKLNSHGDDLMLLIRASDQPLDLRIAAYDTVVRYSPEAIYELDSFIKSDGDEHLYNYHYTTVENLIKSSNPHLGSVIKDLKNITRPLQLSYTLSGSHVLEYIDKETGKGEKFAISYVTDRRSGFPNIATLENFVIDGSRWTSSWRLQIISKNVFEMGSAFLYSLMYRARRITHTQVLQFLQECQAKIAKGFTLEMHIIMSYKNRAIFGGYYNRRNRRNPHQDLKKVWNLDSSKRSRSFVYYHENSERQFVSDMGLPIIFENKVPYVTTLNLPWRYDFLRDITEIKLSRHAHHSMSIYNPFGDVWHEIKRSSVINLQLPITPLHTDQHRKVLDIHFKSNAGRNMTYGVSTYVSAATIIRGNESHLSELCPECLNHVEVKNNIDRRSSEVITDFEDFGFKFSKKISDCDKEHVHRLMRTDFINAVFKESKDNWKDTLVSAYVATRQYFRTLLPDSRNGTCRVTYKAIRMPNDPHLILEHDFVDGDKNDTYPYILTGKRLKINGTLGTSDNTSRHWVFDINAEMNKGHTYNTLNIKLNSITPGDSNTTICVNASKSYPDLPHDPLSINWTREVTITKFEFSMAENEDGECSRNDTLVDVSIRGELSLEQKERFERDDIAGLCKADTMNTRVLSSKSGTRKTVDCLERAIMYTTLRNYTVDVYHKNVPMSLTMPFYKHGDSMKALFLPRGVYQTDDSELDRFKMNAVFPFMSRMSEANNESLPIRQRLGPDADRDLWTCPLDNSRFPVLFLWPYLHNYLRLCSVFPKSIRTFDGGLIPYNITSSWTLISGDCIYGSYAVFVKETGGILQWRIMSGNNEIELSPKSDGYTLKINGEDAENIEPMIGIRIPTTGRWEFRISPYGSTFIIELSNKLVSFVYSSDSVTLVTSDFLQGKMMGLCGRMDGTHKTLLPKAYHLSDV